MKGAAINRRSLEAMDPQALQAAIDRTYADRSYTFPIRIPTATERRRLEIDKDLSTLLFLCHQKCR